MLACGVRDPRVLVDCRTTLAVTLAIHPQPSSVCVEEEDPAGGHGGSRRACLDLGSREVRVLASMFPLLASVTVPVTIAIGVVFIIAGVVYMFRRKMLLGVVLVIIGILLGGLNIFGVFD
jgi:hypothetical protein